MNGAVVGHSAIEHLVTCKGEHILRSIERHRHKLSKHEVDFVVVVYWEGECVA